MEAANTANVVLCYQRCMAMAVLNCCFCVYSVHFLLKVATAAIHDLLIGIPKALLQQKHGQGRACCCSYVLHTVAMATQHDFHVQVMNNSTQRWCRTILHNLRVCGALCLAMHGSGHVWFCMFHAYFATWQRPRRMISTSGNSRRACGAWPPSREVLRVVATHGHGQG